MVVRPSVLPYFPAGHCEHDWLLEVENWRRENTQNDSIPRALSSRGGGDKAERKEVTSLANGHVKERGGGVASGAVGLSYLADWADVLCR